MGVLVLGGCVLLVAIASSQWLLWRVTHGHGDDEINEFAREIDGRRAVLNFFEHDGVTHVRASIDLPGAAAPRLELARRGRPPVLAKWVGALAEHALADQALAERFVCRAPESPRAFEALGRMKARILEAGGELCELKLDERSLAIVLAGVRRSDTDRVGALLGGLARAVLGPGGVLVHGEDTLRARCGFCHADLAAEDLAAVACEECSAVVHELCWTEHGCCPVLGCKGRGPKPVPAERLSSGGSASSAP